MSQMSDIAAKVHKIVEPTVTSLGIELIETEYVKEGANKILRLYIDKTGGVGLDDCEAVSRATEPLVDDANLISEAYKYEVSSPGLERPLKTDRDYERYKGEDIEVNLYAPRDGQKKFEGKLQGRQDGVVTILDSNGKELSFGDKEISVVRRTIIW